ncbi:MAG TPA: tetratricopeptide repeat protein, partial [Thermoanaerobaculia bacterium]|nr:tetratricopeptide repeat protein [Thermoanaerobaculia bacterium]
MRRALTALVLCCATTVPQCGADLNPPRAGGLKSAPHWSADLRPLSERAWELWRIGKMEASLAAFHELLAAARAEHDRRVEASTINFIGLWHQNMGEYAEARRHYEEALTLARAAGDRDTEAVALYQMAWLRFVEHDYRGAIVWYERSLAVFRAIPDRHGQAVVLAGLGMAYNSLAEWSRAIELEQQALAIVQTTSDRRLEADILDHTGRAMLGSGRTAEAEALHRRALAVRREAGDRGGQTFSLSALAYAQRAQNDVDGAIASMQDVVAIIEASREAVASSRLRQT